jgi:hypothetical protein
LSAGNGLCGSVPDVPARRAQEVSRGTRVGACLHT